MPSKVILTLSSGTSQQEAAKLQVVTGQAEALTKVINFFDKFQSGNQLAYGVGVPPSVVIATQGGAVAASGTLTCTSVVATNSFSINGVTFTAVASGATGNQFNVGGSDTITAANIASAINASVTALVAGYVAASSALGVVTVTSAFFGTAGNMTLLASASGTMVASGARLTGGAADSAALTLNF